VKRALLAACFAAFMTGCGAEAADKNPVVVIDTSMGAIKVELYQDKAPVTVKNFLQYVDDKHYDGTVFHRVISNFMIQGGGFEPGMKEKKTRDSIKNESSNGLSNERGTVAMARTNQPDSATAQFYINVKDNDFLDKAKARDKVGYCVFGKVIEGMDVVDKIKEVKTRRQADKSIDERDPKGDEPVEDVTIKSVRVVK
jgi:cyclophilin family peptidyl-prolyl cis-trans isomerase